MENAVISSVARDAARAASPRARTWQAASLFGLGLIATGFALLLAAILLSGADPSGLTFVVPMLSVTLAIGGLVWTRGRWAQGVALAASLALCAMLVPIVPHAAFDSFFDLVPILLCVTGALTVIAAAAADLARRKPSPRLPAVFVGAAVSVVTVIAFVGIASAIATFAGQETLSAAEREGRIPVAMKNGAFAPKTIQATEGEEVRIALKNGDAVIHDLHIEDLDLKFTVKPGSEKAFQFTAPEAGKYAFDCSLHTNLKGVLEVLSK